MRHGRNDIINVHAEVFFATKDKERDTQHDELNIEKFNEMS